MSILLSSQQSRWPITGLGERGTSRISGLYGLAHFGKSLFWYASEILFAFFLTEVAGLSGRAMGWVFAGGLLASVAIDMGLAWLLRQGLADVRFAARLQLLGAVMSAAALGALFLSPHVPQEWRLAYAATIMLGFRFAYAFYDLPQNVMLSLTTRSSRGRSNLAALRLFFSGLATLAVTAVIGPLVADAELSVLADRFLALAGLIALLSLTTAFCLQRGLRRHSMPLASAAQKLEIRWLRCLPQPIPVLLTITFVVSLTTSAFARLEPYFAAYVLESTMWAGAMVTGMAVGMTVSQPAWAWLALRMPWSRLLIVAAALLLFAAIAFLLCARQAVWPALAAAAVFGAASGGIGTVMWAAYGNVVALSLPASAGGPAFALFTGLSKIGLALGAVMLGYLLQSIDYRDQDHLVILAVMTLWPALGGLICALLAGVSGWRSKPI